jgi:sortase A
MAAESDSSYQAQLKVGTATEMGQISVPAIDVRLGIYHGVSETVLDIGAGHIYGTSLPVGGESTHSVITSHSGLRHAELFTRLDELEIGDEFFINSAGQTLRYVVDQIKVVTPDDTSAMNVIPGKDYVTLVTCTPRGLNSHRLYVRGERAPLALAETSVTPTAPVPFPWWAIWFGASSLGTIGLCKVLAITTTTKARSQKQTRSPEKSQPAPLQVSAEANHG